MFDLFLSKKDIKIAKLEKRIESLEFQIKALKLQLNLTDVRDSLKENLIKIESIQEAGCSSKCSTGSSCCDLGCSLTPNCPKKGSVL